MEKFALGLDYGTNSVRALIASTRNGREIASAVWHYPTGSHGIILTRDPNLARHHPADYVKGTSVVIRQALALARKTICEFAPSQIIGIGVDATGSTPMPVDRAGQPLAFQRRFAKNPASMAWLWKDHTSTSEGDEITALAKKIRPEYLAKCGGAYSSEYFFSKILHCLRHHRAVFDAAHLWVECADWIPAMLTGTETPETFTAGICAAGHKAMFNHAWGGYPDKEFLSRLDPRLAKLRLRLPRTVRHIGERVGTLKAAWAKQTGLPAGIPVSAGALDAHLGAVGAGIATGTLVKIVGTSTCDMMIVPERRKLADVPGLCGIVPDSIVPGYVGLEAGQAAVGDIFNWFINYIQPHGAGGTHEHLSAAAARLRPGESGLLALDWNNGNRNILMDQRLTGLLLGQTLYTQPAEIYRALIEATAFGALIIIRRFEEHGIPVQRIVTCGGIAEKNPLVMQIYADVTGRVINLSRSSQTCALGAAIAGSVAAGKELGGHATIPEAQKRMTGLKSTVFRPNPKAQTVYRQLFKLYQTLHDAFGTKNATMPPYYLMKELFEIRDRVRAQR